MMNEQELIEYYSPCPTRGLEQMASDLHRHNELFPLDENAKACLDAILAVLDNRGAL